MKASELIKALQEEITKNGDKNIVIAANRHSYADAKVIAKDDNITLALYNKIDD